MKVKLKEKRKLIEPISGSLKKGTQLWADLQQPYTNEGKVNQDFVNIYGEKHLRELEVRPVEKPSSEEQSFYNQIGRKRGSSISFSFPKTLKGE